MGHLEVLLDAGLLLEGTAGQQVTPACVRPAWTGRHSALAATELLLSKQFDRTPQAELGVLMSPRSGPCAAAVSVVTRILGSIFEKHGASSIKWGCYETGAS